MRKSNNIKKFCESSSPGEKEFSPRKLWKDRKAKEFSNPLEFIDCVYTQVLGKIPTREFIRGHDMPLYNAHAKWVSRHPEDNILPKSLDRTPWSEKLGRKIDPFDKKLLKKISSKMSSKKSENFQRSMSTLRHKGIDLEK